MAQVGGEETELEALEPVEEMVRLVGATAAGRDFSQEGAQAEEREENEEERAVWVPYSERPEWADVIPFPESPQLGIVDISYTSKFKDTMRYFLAVAGGGERSARVNEIAKDAILLNPGNYTAWQVRRECLEAMEAGGGASGDDFYTAELVFADELALISPKNYQIWHHRRMIVEKLGADVAADELDFTASMVEMDPKNYHAWSHRQWIVKSYNLWAGELAYCSSLLDNDMRNNSAWSHRFFIVTQEKSSPQDLGGDTGEGAVDGGSLVKGSMIFYEEVEYAWSHIYIAPHNESAWNYLIGLYRFVSLPLSSEGAVENFCRQTLNRVPQCRFALSTLVLVLEEILLRPTYAELLAAAAAAEAVRVSEEDGGEEGDSMTAGMGEASASVEGRAGEASSSGVTLTREEWAMKVQAMAEGERLCGQLILADPIRAGYWRYRRNLLVAGVVDPFREASAAFTAPPYLQ